MSKGVTDEQKHQICSSTECQNTIKEKKIEGLTFLSRNIFGLFGSRLVQGYCIACSKRNLSRAFLAFVVMLSLVVAIMERPWKGPLFAMVVILFWTAILRQRAFRPPKKDMDSQGDT